MSESVSKTSFISSFGPAVSQTVSKVQQSIPEPVNQMINKGISQVQQEVPKAKNEVAVYARDFRPSLTHLIFLSYFLALFLRQALPFSINNLAQLNFWVASLYLFLSWMIGGLIGWNLLFLDNVVYIYISHPQSPAASQAKSLLRQKGFVEYFKFLLSFKGNQHLALRSVLFQAAWLVLALFALTSSSSYLGKGVVMGLGLHLLLENWQMEIRYPQMLNNRLFWQIKRPVDFKEQNYFLYIFTGLFVILSLLI